MNLSKLFEMQKELDAKIIKEKGLEGQDLLLQKILALQVELGECANSWRGFKFWSTNQQPKPDLLEEYCDCLHFILSIGLEIDETNTTGLSFPNEKNLTAFGQFVNTMDFAAKMHYDNYFSYLLASFVDLGYTLGFTWEQIEQAYLDKNEVNHNRQATGY